MSVIQNIKEEKEILWINDRLVRDNGAFDTLSWDDMIDASERLERFAPLIERLFPETAKSHGIIESELTCINNMKDALNKNFDTNIIGNLFIKEDNALPVSGSVKARGGFYEVLCYAEKLIKEHRLLKDGQSYADIADGAFVDFFNRYTIQVGSTGNLGMSIGLISSALGFRTVVHMSKDAKDWKKQLLRDKGVIVIEYESDYGEAVNEGRRQSSLNAMSYFVDDENSKHLFLGYSVAAIRLKRQLEQINIAVDGEHPLFVYIPCGIGGAPGGITFGLKQIYGGSVHCFFVEPTKAPCMMLGMLTGRNGEICVQDVGLSGLTEADGLAVGRPSSFVGAIMKPILSGVYSVKDSTLYEYLKLLWETEKIFIEPSACAAFRGVASLNLSEMKAYLSDNGLENQMQNATHIVWATGGNLVPQYMREEYLNKALLRPKH